MDENMNNEAFENYSQLLKQREEEFLTARVRNEAAISTLAKQLADIDPKVLEGLDIPSPLTLQALTPEAYAEEPNPEVYKEQYDKAALLCANINKRFSEYNQEAMKCMQSYREQASLPQ